MNTPIPRWAAVALIPMLMLAAPKAPAVPANTPALTPPDAKPGECYARVLIPAQYTLAEEDVVVQEATEAWQVVPPEFAVVEENITVTPAHEKWSLVPAVYAETNTTVIVKPAVRGWATGLEADASPVNPVILKAIARSGVDLNASEPGSCLSEYYRPRQYETVEKEVVVQAERNETEIVPAVFGEEEKTVVVKPQYTDLTVVPAAFEEVEEKVLIEPERTAWKKGTNPAQQLNGATGEIMCLVTLPARYKTIKKQRLKSPPKTETEVVPPQTRTVTVHPLLEGPKTVTTPVPPKTQTVQQLVLKNPPQFAWLASDQTPDAGWFPTGHRICRVDRPAETVTVITTVLDTPAAIDKSQVEANITQIPVEKLITEANITKTPIPAKTIKVTRRKLSSPSHMEWRRILCQTNMTEATLKAIQEALIARGYDPGKPDGKIGAKTRNALARFQKDNGLATGGITYETLSALKLSR